MQKRRLFQNYTKVKNNLEQKIVMNKYFAPSPERRNSTVSNKNRSTSKSLNDFKYLCTLSLKSLSLLLSVCYKTTQTTGGVGVAGAYPPTSKLGGIFVMALCSKSAYIKPRTVSKMSPI